MFPDPGLVGDFFIWLALSTVVLFGGIGLARFFQWMNDDAARRAYARDHPAPPVEHLAPQGPESSSSGLALRNKYFRVPGPYYRRPR